MTPARQTSDTRIDRAIAYLLGVVLTGAVTFTGWLVSCNREESRAAREELTRLSSHVAVLEAVCSRVEKRLDAVESVRK